ncbi:hypothetical protein AYY18_12355 [Morganella psychrotolerans]|uniref:Uncharacterized protein n=1 Tax=Morganella psychrotolerans TaxID=368603 RepID=A0A1B8GZE2_9GAMM|nr:hypothetical protein AYY18_12355 [Morganella psychrotolerans]
MFTLSVIRSAQKEIMKLPVMLQLSELAEERMKEVIPNVIQIAGRRQGKIAGEHTSVCNPVS